MIDNSPHSIRTKVIETIGSEYREIFGLSPEDRSIVQKNLLHMTDVELGNEILHLQKYFTTNNHIYQNALIATVHVREEEEKSDNNLLYNL